MTRLKLILLLLFSTSLAQSQEKLQADSIYNNALELYQQKEIDKAKLKFEKVLELNRNYKDAIFNLGVINYEQGNKEKAINLFQTCVKLGDRNSAELLKSQLGQTILFADTMHIDDLDVLPKVMVNAKAEEIFINKAWNKIIEKQVLDGFRKSKILKKELGGKKIFLSMYFGKDGRLDAKLLGSHKEQIVQDEISLVLQQILIIPGKYQNKDVTTSGITVPIQL